MNYKSLCLLFPVLLCVTAAAQTKIPVIHAHAKSVSIRDGGFLDKNVWTLNPAARPDVYTADRTREIKYVTFYTDIDSIRVRLKPGGHFDFLVLLNGKDSCFTRIASAIPGSQGHAAASDTIPFILTPFSAIAVKAVLDGRDTVTMHFDLSAFGLKLTKTAILQKTQLLRGSINDGRVQPDYRHLKKAAMLQMGTLILDNPDIRATDLTAREMDGRFGWDLFEDRVVEINYEKQILVIHAALPGKLRGYRRSALHFIRSFPCAPATIVVDGKHYSGDFILDTGTDQSLVLDSAWMAADGFPKGLKLISSKTLRDPRGTPYETKNVEVPLIRLNDFQVAGVPALELENQHPAGFVINFLGNGLLRRFDMIVDFHRDILYLKKIECSRLAP